jgi:ketosteroid isomerase-like protein
MRHLLALAAALLGAAAQAQPAEPTLEQRVQRIEDEAAIERVILDYAVTLDARDFDAYVALFAREGVWRNGNTIRTGPADIREMLVGLYGEPDPGYVNTESYRIVSNVEIALDGDRATARSRQLTIMRGEDGAPTPVLSGIYEDEFVREEGAWKILRRVDHTIMPSPEQWRARIEALRAAREETSEGGPQ